MNLFFLRFFLTWCDSLNNVIDNLKKMLSRISLCSIVDTDKYICIINRLV